jgi:hypothetical protein
MAARATWYGGPGGAGPDGMSIYTGSCGYGRVGNHYVSAWQGDKLKFKRGTKKKYRPALFCPLSLFELTNPGWCSPTRPVIRTHPHSLASLPHLFDPSCYRPFRAADQRRVRLGPDR